ncbi:MAG: hypothetical protein ABIM89_06865 [Mycobacteriales bacterium]
MMVGELLRKAALEEVRDELPQSIAVVVVDRRGVRSKRFLNDAATRRLTHESSKFYETLPESGSSL